MRNRFTKAEWLREGLRTLAREGPSGLKAAPMAARLGISRGSFYWHFRDMAAFKKQLLSSWRAATTDRVIGELDASKAGPDRLKDLLHRAMIMQRSRLDRAVRVWAGDDRNVAKAIAAVDGRRIAYIAKLLTESGAPRTRASGRATFIYWAYLGQEAIGSPHYGAISVEALADLAALFGG